VNRANASFDSRLSVSSVEVRESMPPLKVRHASASGRLIFPGADV
jgi:hypothetical protein